MNQPFFYIDEQVSGSTTIVLGEENSRHIVQVLRMKPGAQLNLVDGKGNIYNASVTDDHKKHCAVNILSTQHQQAAIRQTSIAISLLKNSNRFEWFLEKATELGISTIIPLICERTEKEKFREERLKQIMISAMIQSQQVWLPTLHHPIDFSLLLKQDDVIAARHKFIAHCEEATGKKDLNLFDNFNPSSILLIGPEGDFTKAEVEMALQNQFIPVSLGETRLRTETAGVVGATILKLHS